MQPSAYLLIHGVVPVAAGIVGVAVCKATVTHENARRLENPGPPGAVSCQSGGYNTPNTMAPTKAMAAYAVTTLTLLTKGPSKVIATSPSFTSLPAQLCNIAKRSRPKK